MRCFPALTALALSFAPLAAQAQMACPPDAFPILSCSFENGAKWLTSCQDGNRASYAFGKAGRAPDLQLSTSVAALDYTPWPGVGRAIWEEVRFYNADVTYVLWYNFDKFYALEAEQAAGAPDPLIAGILVTRGDQELARLECDPGSIVVRMDALEPAKEALGLCWDRSAFSWAPCAE